MNLNDFITFHKFNPSGTQEKHLSQLTSAESVEFLATLIPVRDAAVVEFETEKAGAVKVHYLKNGEADGYWPNEWANDMLRDLGKNPAEWLTAYGPVVLEYRLA